MISPTGESRTTHDATAASGASARAIREGVVEALPLIGAVAPFAAIFGAAAVAEGYTMAEAVLTSALVFAGASQFVFIEVDGLGVPAWSVVLAVFAVNFRHILYSASVGRKLNRFSPPAKLLAFFWLTDLQWAASELRSAERERDGVSPAWYFAFALPLYAVWVLATAVGGFFGAFLQEPERFGFDFLVPIYFLTILMSFRKRTNFVPVVAVSAVVSALVYATLGAPWHISLGALAGIGAAAFIAQPPHHRLMPKSEGDQDG